jgi:hypothetical protein
VPVGMCFCRCRSWHGGSGIRLRLNCVNGEVHAYIKTEGDWTLGLRNLVEIGDGKERGNGETHTLIGLHGP